tara:strand:- start:26 stop:208 length:183 start_codon:yes stop_codon:yes gene_type:complete
MKVGDMVLPDFPPHRDDWRADWPDNTVGIIVEEHFRGKLFTVMTPMYQEEICIDYLVEIV